MGITAEKLAAICHEANRAYCEAIGDKSQVTWDNAPDWQKVSAVAGVITHLRDMDITPEQSHKAWMEHKASEGWGYGPEKDFERKTHPCMVPYDQLPEAQRAKDHLFRGIIHSLAGFVVSPPKAQRVGVEGFDSHKGMGA